MELEDITAIGKIATNTLIVNSETGGTIASISMLTIKASDWIHAGEIELEDITSTGTATFAKAIVDDMNIEDLTAQRAVFNAFYLEGSNNANSIETNGKLVNDIDLSGFSGEYSDNHIMSSKAINELIAKNNESYNLTLNEPLTNTLANYVKTDSLATTLNDYTLKTEIPEVDLSGYRKGDDLIVVDAAQSLPIGSIDSFTESSSINFENITTASVEYSDEIVVQGITFIGTFVCVADESIRYDFEITYKAQATLFALLKTMQISATYDPPANKFEWAMASGGLWLGTDSGRNGFRPGE